MAIFALIDCNNFFVSCERVFRPDLWHKPVAVLSNNDGCIVARSNEVKALGVPMGVPHFKVRDVLQKHNVTLFSGNFALYGDFSQRVVSVLRTFSPDIEVYSVDESFLEISTLPIADYTAWGQTVADTIWRVTGIPVSVGIAPTKTLAKAAADYVKKQSGAARAYSLIGNTTARQQLLNWLPVGDVWGIGRRTTPKLEGVGIRTANQLAQASDAWVRAQLGVNGVKTVHELRGRSCYSLEQAGEPQKTILRSRSFGHTIRNYYELEGAVATFAAQGAAKLRAQNSVTAAVLTYLQPSAKLPYQPGATTVTRLTGATNDTGKIITAALGGLARLYDTELAYKKAGVSLLAIVPATARQLAFADDAAVIDKQVALMRTVDAINTQLGRRTVRHASEHVESTAWHSSRKLRSPAYTTSWQDVPVAHA